LSDKIIIIITIIIIIYVNERTDAQFCEAGGTWYRILM
jgi:hypothetical protein